MGLTKNVCAQHLEGATELRIGLRRGEGGVGWRWGKREKAGTALVAKTIKINKYF